ncbi:MAG: ABC transporter substrate-binding protein [Betaproteobacteria bacterium RIFCSPLOWO2_02_FULL_65_24]|nr:MAG: ABC transporter substrate-binding protein [Betaproteobacteria bacterium RIFCSPLOWO2_02_FULL_65_24]OGA96467.1 MAG: ABC transporter substrate-binding protein [Betaproteobacteria bacterium RIFCSPLOWO2_12_FULL_66_14]
MLKLLQLAARNLLRYRRRTILTSLLIVIGVMAVLVFVAITGSFKSMMVSQITDSFLGHLQVHRRGYVASIESLPLNMNMPAQLAERVQKTLADSPDIVAYAPRIKFGAMFSNFNETTSVRVNGIDPEREAAVTPLLAGRQADGVRGGPLLERGQMLVPELVARGLQVKAGDTIVLIATNRDGSVNGKTFVIRGTLESATGPGGRDGYVHIEDAREMLRLEQPEISEFAARVKDMARVEAVAGRLAESFSEVRNKEGRPSLEVHAWQKLSPFANIASMIDLLTVSIKVMLVAIVLVAVMNVMIMAVYERIREIGAIAAIGTPPARILWLFLNEGLLLGVLGTLAGAVLSVGAVYGLAAMGLTFNFGQQQGLVLAPELSAGDVLTVSLMVIAVAILASVQPAWKASRMDPIQALRHV